MIYSEVAVPQVVHSSLLCCTWNHATGTWATVPLDSQNAQRHNRAAGICNTQHPVVGFSVEVLSLHLLEGTEENDEEPPDVPSKVRIPIYSFIAALTCAVATFLALSEETNVFHVARFNK
jgi:hypothetical protein